MIGRVLTLSIVVLMLGVPLTTVTKAQAATTELTFWTFVTAHAKY